MSTLKISKKPKSPTIIVGFPGFGLIGTIATEFLIEHLTVENIGVHYFEELPATIAIHNEKVIEPMSVYYNKKYNLIIFHSMLAPKGMEWKLADVILDVAKQTGAKEIISLEGVSMGMEAEKERVFFYTNKSRAKAKLEKTGCKVLHEGIVIGVTASLLLKSKKPITVIFAETHSKLPDSKASAKIIKILDNYLNLKVDYKPLLATAKKFEDKLRSILKQGTVANEEQKRKMLSYVG